jgi:hypothetical protein
MLKYNIACTGLGDSSVQRETTKKKTVAGT